MRKTVSIPSQQHCQEQESVEGHKRRIVLLVVVIGRAKDTDTLFLVSSLSCPYSFLSLSNVERHLLICRTRLLIGFIVRLRRPLETSSEPGQTRRHGQNWLSAEISVVKAIRGRSDYGGLQRHAERGFECFQRICP